MNSKFYRAAGITVEVRSDLPISDNTFHPKFRFFEVDGPGEDNVLIHHHFHLPDFSSEIESTGEEIYKNDQWRVFRTEDSWIYQFQSMFPTDPGHSASGRFSKNYTALSVHTTDFDARRYRNAEFSALTLFNNDQLLFAPLLCDRNGLILHSNGFDINGNGVLLIGASGAGKSTLSNMLKKEGHHILCDDRMFITEDSGNFRIHGNWCHGSVPDTAARSAPLNALLFLEQSDNNALEEMKDKRAIARGLLGAIVHPFLTPTGWEKTFDIIETLVQRTKCFRTEFDLSGKVCHEISSIFQ